MKIQAIHNYDCTTELTPKDYTEQKLVSYKPSMKHDIRYLQNLVVNIGCNLSEHEQGEIFQNYSFPYNPQTYQPSLDKARRVALLPK